MVSVPPAKVASLPAGPRSSSPKVQKPPSARGSRKTLIGWCHAMRVPNSIYEGGLFLKKLSGQLRGTDEGNCLAGLRLGPAGRERVQPPEPRVELESIGTYGSRAGSRVARVRAAGHEETLGSPDG